MSDLAQWQTSKFEDVIDRISNGTALKQQNDRTNYPVSRIETISDGTVNFEKIKYVTPTSGEVEKYQILPGDVLFSNINSDAHLGKTAIFRSSKLLLHGINTLLIRVNDKVNADYFNYYCQHLRSAGVFIGIASHAVNQSSINQTKIKALEIPLPQMQEQEKIVAKIEELFSEIDKGIELMKVSMNNLISYQQSLLNSLFSENEVTTLGSLIKDIRYGTSKKCGLDNKLTPVLRIPNIIKGVIDTSDLKFAEFNTSEIEKLSLKVGDLLIIRSNGSPSIVGKCAEVTKKDENYLFAGYLIRMRFDPDSHSAKFYKYMLSSPKLREQIEFKAKSTSGVNNINSEELKSLIVPKLSLEEQKKIVSILEEKSSEIDSLRDTIIKTSQTLESLKKSVLSKAFKGGLV